MGCVFHTEGIGKVGKNHQKWICVFLVNFFHSGPLPDITINTVACCQQFALINWPTGFKSVMLKYVLDKRFIGRQKDDCRVKLKGVSKENEGLGCYTSFK